MMRCLSNLLHTISKNPSPTYDSIVAVLQSYYRVHNKNNEDIIQYLLEAGNSGNDIYIESIRKYIESSDQEIRRESLYALRFMHSLRADSLLSTEIGKNPDSTQVSWIYAAIKSRFPSERLQKAPGKYVKANAKKNKHACVLFLEYLNNYMDEVPSIRSEMISLKTIPGFTDTINDMVAKHDAEFAIFDR
jgi:hypothetical protein